MALPELAGVLEVEVGVDNPPRGRAMGVLWGVASVIVINGNMDVSCSALSHERPVGVITVVQQHLPLSWWKARPRDDIQCYTRARCLVLVWGHGLDERGST